MLKNTAENKLIKLDDGSYVEAEYVFLVPSMPPPNEDGLNAYSSGFLAVDEQAAATKTFFKDVTIGWFVLADGENLLDKAHDAAIAKWPQLERCDSPESDVEGV